MLLTNTFFDTNSQTPSDTKRKETEARCARDLYSNLQRRDAGLPPHMCLHVKEERKKKTQPDSV
jgi:hypothetical protein